MAEVIRYVNTAADAGGNGTTNNESSGDGTHAYQSLSAWEAAEQTDLVSAGNWHHVYCSTGSGTAADTASCVINGWTTAAANYILIEAADGDQATVSGWDTSRYRLQVTDAESLRISDNFVRVDGLQVGVIYSSVANKQSIFILSVEAPSDIRIGNCRIQGANNTSAQDRGIEVTDTDASLKIYNTIITDIDGRGIFLNDCAAADIYNCIVYHETGTNGIEIDSGTVSIKNCAVFNCVDDFQDDSGSATIDYCASDDGDGTNAVAASGSDWDNEYVDSANGDFTPVGGGNTVDGGVNDPGSGLYSAGMDGVSYTTDSWSIGVVQYVAAGGGDIAIFRRRRN